MDGGLARSFHLKHHPPKKNPRKNKNKTKNKQKRKTVTVKPQINQQKKVSCTEKGPSGKGEGWVFSGH